MGHVLLRAHAETETRHTHNEYGSCPKMKKSLMLVVLALASTLVGQTQSPAAAASFAEVIHAHETRTLQVVFTKPLPKGAEVLLFYVLDGNRQPNQQTLGNQFVFRTAT